MAKRSIRKSDPVNTNAPTRRRKVNGEATAADAAPKVTRARRKVVSAPAEPVSATISEAAEAELIDATATSHIPHELIAVRAYHLYLARGGRGGDQYQDWLVAERELRDELSRIGR
jgi:hypothetical protein